MMSPDPVVGQQVGDAVRGAVPPWLVPVFIAITRLGNPALFLAVFAVDYWFGDRRRGAHALALAIGGYALITALKTFFDAPRPPSTVNVIPISGYSFPSGHATSATIGYGILAYDLEVGSWPTRYAVAGVAMLLVALSRVVLGVHYVRDVVAGIVVGLAFLAGVVWLTEHDPKEGFVVAIALGAVAFVVSGASHDGATILGAAVGATLAYTYLDAVPRVDGARARFALLGVVAPVLGALAYVGEELLVDPLVAFVLYAVTMAGVLLAPTLAVRLGADRERETIDLS
ncbi:phosphatase PAP2 family protein [Halorussus limi]|uniref:Phosphatase PAP2 family protein n=1 Tax=Halorussus limi TaxID=2938695 RepID=A0A8U0HRZ9_9EURY|nr:phosphatase PAP2 family protein [Halorussus limi]UPV73657.1 phosphatase PAP2 family protein [Halorussus limi]